MPNETEQKITFLFELPPVALEESDKERIAKALRTVIFEELAKTKLRIKQLDPIAEQSRGIGGGITMGFRAI